MDKNQSQFNKTSNNNSSIKGDYKAPQKDQQLDKNATPKPNQQNERWAGNKKV